MTRLHHRLEIAIGALALVATVCPCARAADVAPPARETRWYGWQNLVADGVALGFIGGAAFAGRGDSWPGLARGMVIFGTAGWLTFSPAIHLAHHRPGTALASFGLRALPVLVFAASVGSWSCSRDLAGNTGSASDDSCSTSATRDLVTIGITMTLALVVDDVVLAREDAPTTQTGFVQPTFSFMRAVDGHSSTPTFGFAGAF